MNDTHGVEDQPWIGFDLDGTLAKYDKWEGIDHIGEPVKPMVDLIKKLHDEGKVVKIITARVAPRSNIETKFDPYLTDKAVYDAVGRENEEKYADVYRKADWTAYEFIADWCLKNLGFLPEITHEKDHLMIECYDDRVKQVIPNDGRLVEDIAIRNFNTAEKALSDLGWALSKVESKRNGFMAGMMLGMMIWVLAFLGVKLYENHFEKKAPAKESVEKLVEAAHAVLECDFTGVK